MDKVQEKTGYVTALHLHPSRSGESMQPETLLHLVAERGIEGNTRYWDRKARDGGPGKRQVTVIEREQIDEHAFALGLKNIPVGVVRSNIEITGFDLRATLGKKLQIGEAVIQIVEFRTPCNKMDQIAQGLRNLMEEGKQGIVAQIVRSGMVKLNDEVKYYPETDPA